jgi:energy-coupling factor transport system ATP-binding protein
VTTIAIEGLVFDYPDGTRALDGVDLAIGAGERIVIVGPNGSGKSTLIRHLDGLLRPTGGRVLIDGRDIAGVRVARLAAIVGIVFQDPDRQIFARRVDAEVAFGPRHLGRRGDGLEAAVAGALDAVGLSDVRSERPYDLGYSRRKLLGLASILAMRTPVVVLDEPTTGQDARGIDRVRSIVRSIADDGRTLIAISHDMAFAAAEFERVVVMRAGRVVLDGAPTSVFGEASWPILADASLEPPLAARRGVAAGIGATPTPEALATALRDMAGADHGGVRGDLRT